MRTVYKLENGNEVEIPGHFVRVGHLMATVGNRVFELVDSEKDHFFLYEVEHNRLVIMQIGCANRPNNAVLALRTLHVSEFHVRFHPSENEHMLAEGEAFNA
jgi:hypothetical protein